MQGANVLTNGGESNYHALQFEVTRRTRHGLQGQFSYTFGKSLSNTAGDSQTGLEPLLDNDNPQLEWARSPYDMRHVFKANYYYELPFGKGKQWSGNAITNARPGQLGGQRHLELPGRLALLGALHLRHAEPPGAFQRHQHGVGQRHDARSTGAADGRACS